MYNMTEAGIECVRSLNVEYLPLKYWAKLVYNYYFSAKFIEETKHYSAKPSAY